MSRNLLTENHLFLKEERCSNLNFWQMPLLTETMLFEKNLRNNVLWFLEIDKKHGNEHTYEKSEKYDFKEKWGIIKFYKKMWRKRLQMHAQQYEQWLVFLCQIEGKNFQIFDTTHHKEPSTHTGHKRTIKVEWLLISVSFSNRTSNMISKM